MAALGRDPWTDIRDAIFFQAFTDFRKCPKKTRDWILNTYAGKPIEKRRELLAKALDARMPKVMQAADSYEFFHSRQAAEYLVDCEITGPLLWEELIRVRLNGGKRMERASVGKGRYRMKR